MICNSDSPERFPQPAPGRKAVTPMIPFRLQTGRNGQQEISVATPLEFLFFAGWFVAWREKRDGIKRKILQARTVNGICPGSVAESDRGVSCGTIIPVRTYSEPADDVVQTPPPVLSGWLEPDVRT